MYLKTCLWLTKVCALTRSVKLIFRCEVDFLKTFCLPLQGGHLRCCKLLNSGSVGRGRDSVSNQLAAEDTSVDYGIDPSHCPPVHTKLPLNLLPSVCDVWLRVDLPADISLSDCPRVGSVDVRNVMYIVYGLSHRTEETAKSIRKRKSLSVF